ncbi:hypothetical protein FQR65_LT10581 [Abscondita terminalis]|nr:hypothetical protein FQR65_LT10581 [Abscondita terminalis]
MTNDHLFKPERVKSTGVVYSSSSFKCDTLRNPPRNLIPHALPYAIRISHLSQNSGSVWSAPLLVSLVSFGFPISIYIPYKKILNGDYLKCPCWFDLAQSTPVPPLTHDKKPTATTARGKERALQCVRLNRAQQPMRLDRRACRARSGVPLDSSGVNPAISFTLLTTSVASPISRVSGAAYDWWSDNVLLSGQCSEGYFLDSVPKRQSNTED